MTKKKEKFENFENIGGIQEVVESILESETKEENEQVIETPKKRKRRTKKEIEESLQQLYEEKNEEQEEQLPEELHTEENGIAEMMNIEEEKEPKKRKRKSKKEQEELTLLNEKDVNEIEVEKKRNTIFALILGGVVLFLFIGFMVISYFQDSKLKLHINNLTQQVINLQDQQEKLYKENTNLKETYNNEKLQIKSGINEAIGVLENLNGTIKVDEPVDNYYEEYYKELEGNTDQDQNQDNGVFNYFNQ